MLGLCDTQSEIQKCVLAKLQLSIQELCNVTLT